MESKLGIANLRPAVRAHIIILKCIDCHSVPLQKTIVIAIESLRNDCIAVMAFQEDFIRIHFFQRVDHFMHNGSKYDFPERVSSASSNKAA